MADPPAFLRNIWYFAMPSAALAPGRMVARKLLDEPVLIGRDRNGKAFAMRDVCPHRAIPLSFGKFDGKEVECRYHGWRFDGEGRCTHIPALTGNEPLTAEKVRVRTYRLHEAQGCIWIFMQAPRTPPVDPPEPPGLPGEPGDAAPVLTVTMPFPCAIDHAVVGLMDPAHGPFVHKSWWWRSQASVHEKEKRFGPSPLGFTMLRHAPSRNSFAYKILGGSPETEISFLLPGIRIESILVGRHRVLNLTTVTPADGEGTVVTHSIYATMRWAWWLKPLLRVFVRRFLEQDRSVVAMQQQGLRYESNLLLVRDADTQARWYYQLKNEFAQSQGDGREFVNPVRSTTLRWRS